LIVTTSIALTLTTVAWLTVAMIVVPAISFTSIISGLTTGTTRVAIIASIVTVIAAIADADADIDVPRKTKRLRRPAANDPAMGGAAVIVGLFRRLSQPAIQRVLILAPVQGLL